MLGYSISPEEVRLRSEGEEVAAGGRNRPVPPSARLWACWATPRQAVGGGCWPGASSGWWNRKKWATDCPPAVLQGWEVPGSDFPSLIPGLFSSPIPPSACGTTRQPAPTQPHPSPEVKVSSTHKQLCLTPMVVRCTGCRGSESGYSLSGHKISESRTWPWVKAG